MIAETHAHDRSEEGRFAFGANWLSFLETLDDERIEFARASLRRTLEVTDLADKSFSTSDPVVACLVLRLGISGQRFTLLTTTPRP